MVTKYVNKNARNAISAVREQIIHDLIFKRSIIANLLWKQSAYEQCFIQRVGGVRLKSISFSPK